MSDEDYRMLEIVIIENKPHKVTNTCLINMN